MAEVLLDIKGLEKTFPGVRALKGVNLTVNKGEIHALMGENGQDADRGKRKGNFHDLPGVKPGSVPDGL